MIGTAMASNRRTVKSIRTVLLTVGSRDHNRPLLHMWWQGRRRCAAWPGWIWSAPHETKPCINVTTS